MSQMVSIILLPPLNSPFPFFLDDSKCIQTLNKGIIFSIRNLMFRTFMIFMTLFTFILEANSGQKKQARIFEYIIEIRSANNSAIMGQQLPEVAVDDFLVTELLIDKKSNYKPRGIGKLVAALITLAYLFLFPIVVKHIFLFLLASYTIPQVYIIMGIGLHSGVYFIGHLLMYFVYTCKISFFERYRIITTAWPWESNPEKWRILLKETLKTTFLVHFLIVPFLLYLDTKNEIVINFDMEQVPGTIEILAQLFVCSIIEDTWFYWGHRIIHHRWLYRYIHKKHHSYTMTISIAAEHQTILEYLLVSLLSTSIPVKILGSRIHVVCYVVYVVFRIVESINAHCGYDFSWSPYGLLPLCQPSSWHNFHHSHQKGNFSGGFWDYICGTHKPYLEYMKKLKEMQQDDKKSR